MRTTGVASYLPHMALVLMLLTAFPLGALVRDRNVAYVTYLAAAQFVFTFQTAGLLLDWGGGDPDAFGGPFPDHDLGTYYGYGAVNLVIIGAGVGLVTLGARIARSRRQRNESVELG
jgi:hypothetical protein